jgi:hypothetical protein
LSKVEVELFYFGDVATENGATSTYFADLSGFDPLQLLQSRKLESSNTRHSLIGAFLRQSKAKIVKVDKYAPSITTEHGK